MKILEEKFGEEDILHTFEAQIHKYLCNNMAVQYEIPTSHRIP
jgi:hypothetical protein